MTRHGKNVTASAVYSYHERQKDARESGYGSDQVRLGKDSIKVISLKIMLVTIIDYLI